MITFSLLTSRLTPTTWTVCSPWAGSPREPQRVPESSSSELRPMRNAVEVLAAPMNWTSFLPCPAAETGPVCLEYVGNEKCLEMFWEYLRISANSNSVSPFNASYHCRVISNLYCSTVLASNVTRRGAICGHGSKITRSTRQPKLPPTRFWFHRDDHWISNRTTLWTCCACRRLLAGPFRGNGASSRIRVRGLAF